jgi:hypothetical protein
VRVRRNLPILAMSTTVDFDHEAALVAREVREILLDRGLATKVPFLHRESAQMPPGLSLRIAHLPTQGACTCDTAMRLRRSLRHRRTPHP